MVTALLRLEMPKKIDIQIMLKILLQLQKKHKIKRTPLARACNMSYDGLMRYVTFLEALKLVSQKGEKDGIFVSITEIGNDVQITFNYS